MAKEYIEREAVLKHKRKMNGVDWGGGFWDEAVLCEDIRKIPAADVVEVVRCRNCKHKVNFQNRIMCDRNARYSAVHSEWYGLTATDNDNFCSYGERKDGADNG